MIREFLPQEDSMPGHTVIILTRLQLIAKLAAIVNRQVAATAGDEVHHKVSVKRISNFVTECALEFDLSNDEQLLFLKFIVSEKTSAAELIKGETDGKDKH